MGKQYEDWKRKEPGAKLSEHAKRDQVKNNIERAQMESKNTDAFQLMAFNPAKFTDSLRWKVNRAQTFYVILKTELPISEIYERMQKAFGDLR